MRGIGHTLSRLPQVRALLAGAAIIAGSFVSGAHGQSSGSGNGTGAPSTDTARADEAAFAMPHIPRSGSAVAMPKPLSPSDAAAVRNIFALQQRNRIPEAIRATNDLANPLLKGSVLADRFLKRAYRSSSAELTEWLSQYAEQPEAANVHALLLAKLPKGAAGPDKPDVASLSPVTRPPPAPLVPDAGRNNSLPADGVTRSAVDLASQGKVAQALRLASAYRLQPRAVASLRAQVAQVLFTANDDENALRIAQDSLKSTPRSEQNSLTWYVAGLAAWRLDRFNDARMFFQGGADATITTPKLHAATAFWASRAARQQQDAWETVRWLTVAADERMTFHGLLARRLLRMDIGPVPGGDLLTQADVDAVASTAAGWRGFALLQIDQPDRAEAELRTLWPAIQRNADLGRSVLLVAAAAGLPDFAAQLAGLLQRPDGRFDALRYPIPRLQPAGGFRVDRALVYALARTESHFDPAAVSPAGARGLMQIMPATADWVTGGMSAERLREPGINLEVGQRYVSYLAGLDGIGGNLIRLLASYNSGPGNLQRWGAQIRDDGDPLIFIEAIPVAETRDFVPQVLAASWIYAARMQQPIPTLDSLAAGDFPKFGAPAEQTTLVSTTVH
jgi:soluble lytic murein transglycosylase